MTDSNILSVRCEVVKDGGVGGHIYKHIIIPIYNYLYIHTIIHK